MPCGFSAEVVAIASNHGGGDQHEQADPDERHRVAAGSSSLVEKAKEELKMPADFSMHAFFQLHLLAALKFREELFYANLMLKRASGALRLWLWIKANEPYSDSNETHYTSRPLSIFASASSHN